MTPIIAPQQKCWGTTQSLMEMPSCQIHRIIGRIGMCCSQHTHAKKWNRFYVEHGCLRIIYFADGRFKIKRLESGDNFDVHPGVLHRFEVMVDRTIAYEFYWSGDGSEVQTYDIQRLDEGGETHERPLIKPGHTQ